MSNQLVIEGDTPMLTLSFSEDRLRVAKEHMALLIGEDIQIKDERISDGDAIVDVVLNLLQPASLMEKYDTELSKLFEDQSFKSLSNSEKTTKAIEVLQAIFKEIERSEVTASLILEKVDSDWKISSLDGANSQFLMSLFGEYRDFPVNY